MNEINVKRPEFCFLFIKLFHQYIVGKTKENETNEKKT